MDHSYQNKAIHQQYYYLFLTQETVQKANGRNLRKKYACFYKSKKYLQLVTLFEKIFLCQKLFLKIVCLLEKLYI
jgi:hypothetical protein